MSVRMALAKLSACAAGGAVIGGGAVHIAESPKRPAITQQTKIKKAPRRHYAKVGAKVGKVRRQ